MPVAVSVAARSPSRPRGSDSLTADEAATSIASVPPARE